MFSLHNKNIKWFYRTNSRFAWRRWKKFGRVQKGYWIKRQTIVRYKKNYYRLLKKAYNVVANENTELKEHAENIKQRYQQKKKQEYFDREGEYFRQKQQQKCKKVIYEEESDSEFEIEESQYIPEEKEEIEEPKKEKQIGKNNIFNSLNNDAKRNKW